MVAKPRGIFMSAAMFFYTDFVIPGDANKLSLKVSTWRAPDKRVMQNKARSIDDVYEDLARRSLNLFLDRYLSLLMKKAPEPTLPRVELPESDDKDAKDETG
jgi:hypothetical protein